MRINYQSISKFLLFFFITYVIMELIEYCFNYFFNVNLPNLKYGWFVLLIIYGFKFHIFCCLIPFLIGIHKSKKKKKCNCCN